MHRGLGGRMAHYTFLFRNSLEIRYNQEKEIQFYCSIIRRDKIVKEKLVEEQKTKVTFLIPFIYSVLKCIHVIGEN